MDLPEPPQSRAEWETHRGELVPALWRLLGDMPPLFTPAARVLERHAHEGYVVERLVFDNGTGAEVFGYLLLPQPQTAPVPLVIYLHVHGNKYTQGKEELFRERVPGVLPGPTLAKAGYAVLAIDAYGFGERHNKGPMGAAEEGQSVEHALFKHFLWQGASLWGMMLRDDMLALNYALTRHEVDPTRIGVVGMSLGGSRATWLGALDERPHVLIPIAQMTRYRDFAASGQYNLHGVYYYLPAMLKSNIEMEHLVSLAAPRTQAILIGDSDALSPIAGVHKIVDYARRVYQLYDAAEQFTVVIEPGIGHQFTPSMFATMLEVLNKYLLNGSAQPPHKEKLVDDYT
jgi:hypothetical protein